MRRGRLVVTALLMMTALVAACKDRGPASDADTDTDTDADTDADTDTDTDTGTLLLEYTVTDIAPHPQQVLEDCQVLFGE